MENLSNEALIELYQNETCEMKKDEIINYFFNKNKQYPYYLAKKYKHHDLELEDVAGIATIGMMKAWYSFDLSRGIKFITYASRLMANEILMQFRKAEYKKNVTSLDSPLSNDTENITLVDLIPDDTVSFESNIEQKELLRLVVEQAETLLTDREYVIFSNLLAITPKTQRELSEELNISQSYVSRIEARSLKKIRYFLENQSLKKEQEPRIQAAPKEVTLPDVRPKEKIKEIPRNMKETIITPTHQPALQIEGKTVLEKVEYAMQKYPDLSAKQIAKNIRTSVATVRTYISQIKKNQGGEQSMTVTVESKSNLNAEDLNVLAEIKKMEDEYKRLQNIAKEAMEKMLQLSKEKDEMAKQQAEDKNRIERLNQLNHLLMAELVALRGHSQTA